MPAVMNAANEIAVHTFLEKKISFSSIALLVKRVMDAFRYQGSMDLEAILWADRWARTESEKIIAKMQ